MPFVVHGPVALSGGPSFSRGDVLSDALGNAILEEHGSADIARIAADADIVEIDLTPSAPAPAVAPPAPPTPPKTGAADPEVK